MDGLYEYMNLVQDQCDICNTSQKCLKLFNNWKTPAREFLICLMDLKRISEYYLEGKKQDE